MSLTKKIEYQLVADGDITEIDLTDISNIDSARIKWKGHGGSGVDIVTGTTESSIRSKPSDGNYVGPMVIVADAPDEDYYFVQTTLTSYMWLEEYGEYTVEHFWGDGTAVASRTRNGKTDTWLRTTQTKYDTAGAGFESEIDFTCQIRTETTYHKDISVHSSNPSAAVNNSTSSHNGDLEENQESGWEDLNLEPGKINKIHHSVDIATNDDSMSGNIDGERKVFVKIEFSYQPKLESPEIISPSLDSQTTERRPTFELKLTKKEDNDSELYHARLLIYRDHTRDIVEHEAYSQQNPDEWELYENEEWIDFPPEGVAPDSTVRVKINKLLMYEIYYWRAQSNDGQSFGDYTTTGKIKITLTPDGNYSLAVEGEEYICYNLVCSETSNGELGNIEFEVNNKGNQAFKEIKAGDTVTLAVMDFLGNVEQFMARVRVRNPEGETLRVSAITGDGILADRIIREDYPSQDVGLTLKQIVDTYCSPLTTNNINENTGSSMSVKANGKRPIQIFEEIRRKFGLHYYVDKDWDVHLYSDSDITEGTIVVRRGE